MKSIVGLSLLALSHVVAAQNSACITLTTLFPACAYSCITSAGSEVGCPVATDVACRCKPEASSKIQERAFSCVIGGCQAEDINSALKAGGEICRCVATAPPDPEPTSTMITKTSNNPQPTQTSNSVPTTAPPSGSSSAPPSHTTQPPQTHTTCNAVSPCQKSADAVPDCAETCIISAAVTKANCLASDFQCQCASSAVIQGAAQQCVIDGCGIETALQALTSVSAMCACVTASPTKPCVSQPTNTNTNPNTNTNSNSNSSKPPNSNSGTTNPPGTCTGGTKSDCGPVATTAVPSCAHACFSSAAPKVGCGATDYACQCEEKAQASLSQILVPCVASACPAASLPGVIAGASSVCACANAPPAGGTCPTQTGNPPSNPPGTHTNTRTGEPPAQTSKTGGGGCSTPPTVPEPSHSGQPSPSPPVVVVPGVAARYEIGVVAGIFGAVWLIAFAL